MTQIDQTTDPNPKPRHGSFDWRMRQHALWYGPQWYELNTTLGRTCALSMRGLAAVTPIELQMLTRGQSSRVNLEGGRGHVVIMRLTAEQCARYPFDDGLAILAPNANGVLPQASEFDSRVFVVSAKLHDLLHQTPDAFYTAEQCVSALLGLAMLSYQDRRQTQERDRLVYEVEGSIKRLLFAMMRDYSSKRMRHRWGHVRELLTMMHWRNAPLLSRHDESPGSLMSARDLGPFQHGEVEVWRLSRHVVEDAERVDRALVKYASDLEDWSNPASKRKSKPAHPDHVVACSRRGSARIDPSAFQTSATNMCGQLAIHIDMTLKAKKKARSGRRPAMQLELWETISGQAVPRKRKRRKTSRRRASAMRCIERAVVAGTIRPQLGEHGHEFPLVRPKGRTWLLQFEPVRPTG